MYGIHTHRFEDNPEEKRIADLWAERNRLHRTLEYLLCPPHQDQHTSPVPSERDKQVAATVIQWLGSPIGQSFLRECVDAVEK